MILTHGANSISRGDFVEIGGRKYKTVKIGSQIWMAENLDYVWDSLVTNENLPGTSSTHNAVYYNMDEATYGLNGRRCGLLYNQAAKNYLNDTLLQQVAPGWRVPSETDIDNLIAAINDSGNEGYILSKGDISWAPTWTGSNIYGFNAIPNGGYSDGSSFEDDTTQWVIHCAGDRRYVDRYMGYGSGYPLQRGTTNTYPKFCIRLVKDAT